MKTLNKMLLVFVLMMLNMPVNADSISSMRHDMHVMREANGSVIPDFTGDIGNFYHLFKPRSGWWWNPNESGTGLNLDIQQGNIDTEGGGLVFVSYYVYDDAGQPVWYTWAGYWRKSDWQTWHDTGVIGRVESLGNVSRTVGGRPIGGPQQAPAYEDAGLGKAVLEFTDPMNLRLTLGGETREMEWMEWKDDLQSSARCTQGTPENPAQCRYSIMDGDWWAKGWMPEIFDEIGVQYKPDWIYMKNVTDTVSYQAQQDADFNKIPNAPFVASNYVLIGRGDSYAEEEGVWNEAWYAIVRDAEDGSEWFFRFGGYPGYNQSLGYNMNYFNPLDRNDLTPFSVVAMKVVYIDENTAIGIGYDEQDCFLGFDDCGSLNMRSTGLIQKAYFVFRRGVQPSNNDPVDEVDVSQWPSFWQQ